MINRLIFLLLFSPITLFSMESSGPFLDAYGAQPAASVGYHESLPSTQADNLADIEYAKKQLLEHAQKGDFDNLHVQAEHFSNFFEDMSELLNAQNFLDPAYGGNTVLHFVADKGRGEDIALFKWLIENGADYTLKNNGQETVKDMVYGDFQRVIEAFESKSVSQLGRRLSDSVVSDHRQGSKDPFLFQSQASGFTSPHISTNQETLDSQLCGAFQAFLNDEGTADDISLLLVQGANPDYFVKSQDATLRELADCYALQKSPKQKHFQEIKNIFDQPTQVALQSVSKVGTALHGESNVAHNVKHIVIPASEENIASEVVPSTHNVENQPIQTSHPEDGMAQSHTTKTLAVVHGQQPASSVLHSSQSHKLQATTSPAAGFDVKKPNNKSQLFTMRNVCIAALVLAGVVGTKKFYDYSKRKKEPAAAA